MDETQGGPAPAATEDEFVELAIAGIELGPSYAQPATGTIQLLDIESGNRIDIVMARADAEAVQQAVASQQAQRPRTHDLVLSAIAALGARVVGARIVDRRPGGVYLAELVLTAADGAEVLLDARPSDALNVALRADGAGLTARASLLAVSLN